MPSLLKDAWKFSKTNSSLSKYYKISQKLPTVFTHIWSVTKFSENVFSLFLASYLKKCHFSRYSLAKVTFTQTCYKCCLTLWLVCGRLITKCFKTKTCWSNFSLKRWTRYKQNSDSNLGYFPKSCCILNEYAVKLLFD